MASRHRQGKAKTAFLTTQDQATPEEIAKVRTFLDKAANNLYGGRAQLSSEEVKTIAEASVRNLLQKPPGYK